MPNNHLMLDTAAFEAAKDMMKQKFEKIIGYYLEDVQAYIEAIKEGLDKKDPAMIMPAAHTIKSSSRQIGAFALANYTANIEEKARNELQAANDFSKLAESCQDLEIMFTATEQEIKKQL
jgi:HPt (histidine-containing phosphotransfer) domain-containing protein